MDNHSHQADRLVVIVGAVVAAGAGVRDGKLVVGSALPEIGGMFCESVSSAVGGADSG